MENVEFHRYPHVKRGTLVDVSTTSQLLTIEYDTQTIETIAIEQLCDLGLMWKTSKGYLHGVGVNRVTHSVDNYGSHQDTPKYVLCPDYAVDVTEAAGLVTEVTLQPGLLAPRRIRQAESRPLALAGSLINSAFDLLVQAGPLPDDQILERVLAMRPLPVALAAKGSDYAKLITSIKSAMPLLRSMLDKWQGADVTLEPFYASAVYGLQGRADIVLQTPTSSGTSLQIVEMKAGKAPKSGVRADHAAQVSAYAALMMECDPACAPETALWYVQGGEDQLRQVQDQERYFASLLQARNAIVLTELAFASQDSSPLRATITLSDTGKAASSIDRDTVDVAARSLTDLDPTEKYAVSAWLQLIASESVSQQTQDASRYAAITGLTIDPDAWDSVPSHIVLRRQQHEADTGIRRGDAVVCYRASPDGNASPLRYKASVRGITATHVTLSLRNAYARLHEDAGGEWTIISDVMDSSAKAAMSGIASFMKQPRVKREVLLGRRRPRVRTRYMSSAPDLTIIQRDVVERALQADELFLIQGPPGTGKTSAVLRSIIQELVAQPDERVIAAAFTNRAANEICSALDRYGIDYIRHGSQEGATGAKSIPQLMRELSPCDLAERITNARCVVATVQSLSSSAEIWDFGTFTTAVIDEASQLLEPMLLSVTSRVGRSILIGDHCQLPAVVTQPQENLTTAHAALSAIHLTNLAMSGFERLLRCYQHTDYAHEVCGMVTEQGRMHADIMHVASQAFYGGRLRCIRADQEQSLPSPWSGRIPHRAAFIASGIRSSQLEIVQEIVAYLTSGDPSIREIPSIGIISPFRVVNNAILAMLTEKQRESCTVDTVERFQGGERDVVIYLAAADSVQEFDQMRSEVEVDGVVVDRKLNVAITRGREQFIMIGDQVLLSQSPIYARVIDMLSPLAWTL
jgi:DNA replication ATP-dependent helicase Dna2